MNANRLFTRTVTSAPHARFQKTIAPQSKKKAVPVNANFFFSGGRMLLSFNSNSTQPCSCRRRRRRRPRPCSLVPSNPPLMLPPGDLEALFLWGNGSLCHALVPNLLGNFDPTYPATRHPPKPSPRAGNLPSSHFTFGKSTLPTAPYPAPLSSSVMYRVPLGYMEIACGDAQLSRYLVGIR
jgi:hypothetical protein